MLMPLINEDDPHRETEHQEMDPMDPGRSAVLRRMLVGAFPDQESLLAHYGVSTVARLAQWLLAAQRQEWSYETLMANIGKASGEPPDPSLLE